MVVALQLQSGQKPIADVHGQPIPPLNALIGGIPARILFFPHPDGLKLRRAGTGRDGKPLPHTLVLNAMEGFREDVRFVPIQAFAIATAAVNTEYAVFRNGQAMKYGDLLRLQRPWWDNQSIRVFKDSDGKLLSSLAYVQVCYGQSIPVPQDAILIAISELGDANPPKSSRVA
jgi:hypothetical protein